MADRRITDYRELTRIAKAQGWQVEQTRKHLRLTNPLGRKVFCPTTPSDSRHGIHNTIATLRRYGLEV